MRVCHGLPVLCGNREKRLDYLQEIVNFLRAKLKSTTARGRSRSHITNKMRADDETGVKKSTVPPSLVQSNPFNKSQRDPGKSG